MTHSPESSLLPHSSHQSIPKVTTDGISIITDEFCLFFNLECPVNEITQLALWGAGFFHPV